MLAGQAKCWQGKQNVGRANKMLAGQAKGRQYKHNVGRASKMLAKYYSQISYKYIVLKNKKQSLISVSFCFKSFVSQPLYCNLGLDKYKCA
jgi:hypothetical protein